VIPAYLTPADRRRQMAKTVLGFAICTTVVVGYGVAFAYRQMHA
jgi:hypothetical protein